MAVRFTKKGSGMTADTGRLSVPAAIARIVPDGALFDVEVTDDGILYRFAGISEPTERRVTVDTPAWAKDV